MRKSYRYLAAFIFSAVCSLAAVAQSVTITGNVRNTSTKDVVPAVSITVKGSTAGTFTDDKGNFRLVTNQQPPFTIIVSSIGFESKEVQVTSAGQVVDVELTPASTLGVEVVVSASRVPERILESPVSIERVSSANIRNSPATTYYDILKNIKGVDLTYSSLTYATPSTRGFNSSGNARLNQLVDGMDNQAPGLNFSVGSVIGPTELDVESMELLPGASSALYGPGGMNGTLIINSKDPFRYQGLSFQVKTGIMHTDRRQRNNPSPYYDWAVRWGHKASERLAFKIGAQLIHAKDWIALDSSNYLVGDPARGIGATVKPGTRRTDPNYDGVNIYGDETSVDLRLLIPSVAAQIRPSIPAAAQPAFDAYVASLMANPQAVSRTGYLESDVVNNNTINFRLNGGIYYKLTENIEASLTANWGTGNTVYTGSDRYSLKDLKMGQYKLEFKHRDWFLRAYTTQENSGESYNATVTTRLFNEAWKPSVNFANLPGSWYPQYTGAFLLTGFQNGGDLFNAHQAGRATADQGRPVAGSTQFRQLFDQVRKIPIPQGGLFLDRSDLYMVEGQYNFGNRLKIVDLIVGGNWKQYVLDSKGTLFADSTGPISINELGAYAQISRSLFRDRLKLTAAGRYDYNENFPGRFTPRFTAVVKVVENHNIRASYQTAYRFPTTQNQWINLEIGGGTILIGGLPELRSFYKFDTNTPYTFESVLLGNPALLKKANFPEYKPETMRSFEAGYKGLFGKKILVDIYGYYGKYENFLGRATVMQPFNPAVPTQVYNSATRTVFSVAINSTNKVTTYGYGIGVDWLLPRSFTISTNLTADRITDVDSGFVAFFNVPSYRFNISLGNSGFGYQNRFGFNITLRKQDEFFYQSDFRQGTVDGFTTVDAQVSYKFPASRSLVKLGGSNIFNKYYKTAFGNPEIGGLYYISFGYNVF
ncbi:MAG TPA: TonB-dependent receptor [Chitinophagaceae bacterium]|nr:TonB-dependent receptor [Chitinophagaceae bacterium]